MAHLKNQWGIGRLKMEENSAANKPIFNDEFLIIAKLY